MWLTLLKQYWQVAIFKRTPAETPYSTILFAIISSFFFFLIMIQWSIADTEGVFTYISSLLAGVSLLISYYIFTYIVLMLAKLVNRWLQTVNCLLATHAIIHLCAFPLLLIAPFFPNNESSLFMLLIAIVYLIITLALTFWQFMVTIHIYKNALNSDYLPAILASFGLVICNILVVSLWR